MNPELWERLKPLYSAALELPEQGRSGYVEQMCAGDAELARELHALIHANGSAANTLDSPLAGFSLFGPIRYTTLEPGTVLAGRFRIVRHLGSGGMGDVYEAVDLQLEQGRIALKTLRPEIAGNPHALARFKAEVLLARKITGPNICRIHELYLTGSNSQDMPVAFLTMELLDGVTLHDHIEAHSPLPVSEIRLIADQLCGALCCIHEAGIIHRDLKTRNVMLVPHAGAHKVVVMDFGLALISAPDQPHSSNSQREPVFVAGTPSYMAPEQFEGREAGPPTDIYALGLILYELATGVQPFAAHTPLAAAIRRSQQPREASALRHELPSAWDDIIQRCLQYDPAKRFQSASEVIHALKHPGKVALRLGQTHRLSIPRTLLFAVSSALVLILVLVGWIMISNAQRRKLTPEATHWNELGMTALREGSYLKATKLLSQVTQRDPTYAVAHAALADAWSELDFTEQAQHEMLLASSAKEQRGLSDLDRRYIDAVRCTLIRDYTAAAQDYEAILSGDPADRKADGYVDLGRTYEKAGKVTETVASYEQAAQLNSDDPAPFLHLGILRSRLRQPEAAQKAFAKAESLYQAESDLEGLAEVTYQRGFAASEAGAFKDAKQYLNQSLTIAGQIPSVQLKVRSLSQLSRVAYRESQEDLAIAYANEVIQTADANGLPYWSTDGLVRLGNADLVKGDFASAEPVLQQALSRAEQDGHPRLHAAAALTLASVRNQQKRWDEQILFAQSALRYYQDYGFLNMADQAQTLILRGERDKGNLQDALHAGDQLLAIANQTHSPYYIALANEFVGDVLRRLERYPEALTRFEEGTHNLESIGEDPGYLQLHRAEALFPLGRYEEAEAALKAISPGMQKRTDIASSIAGLRLQSLQSLLNFRAALSLAQQTRQHYPANQADREDLDRIVLLAEAQTGQLDKARQGAAQLLTSIHAQANQDAAARAELLAANLDLMAGDAPNALVHAQTAVNFFEAHAMRESQALGLLASAQAAHLQGDKAAAGALSKKSVDIFHQLEQSWGVPAFQIYAKRPDRRKDLQTLAQLREENGAIPNDIAH